MTDLQVQADNSFAPVNIVTSVTMVQLKFMTSKLMSLSVASFFQPGLIKTVKSGA